MDPIAAFRKQQERLGHGQAAGEKSIAELRESNPRWATIFDRLDPEKTGYMKLEEVIRGFKQILGAGSEVPQRHLRKVFKEIDESRSEDFEHRASLDFRQFCELCKKVSQHMMDHPRWAAEEAEEDAREEKERAKAEKERKAREGPDIFAVLGIGKSKDLKEVEKRKRTALAHAHENHEKLVQHRHSISVAGASIVRQGSQGSLSNSRPSSAPRSLVQQAPPPKSLRDVLAGATTQNAIVRRMNKTTFTASAPYLTPGLKRGSATIDAVNETSRAIHGFGSNALDIISSVNEGPPEMRSTSKTASEVPPVELSESEKVRLKWERFSLATPRGTSMKAVWNQRAIYLPDFLPQIRALGKHSAGCFTLSFSRDGCQLAGGFFDGGVRIFDVDKAMQMNCMNLPKWKGGTNMTVEERKRHEEQHALYGEYAQYYAEATTYDLASIMKNWEPVTNLCWKPSDGKSNLLATVDTKGVIALWDVPRAKEARTSTCVGKVETGGSLGAVCFSCDGASVACGGGDKVVHVFDIEAEMGKITFGGAETGGRMLGSSHCFRGKVSGHDLKIVSLKAHPEKPEIIVSAGLDRHILVWDIRASNDHPMAAIYGPELAGDAVDIAKDGNALLCGSHRSKTPIEIYDIRMIEETPPVVAYSWRGNEDRAEGGGKYTSCLLTSIGWDTWETKTIVAAGENENLARVFERPSDPEQPLRVVGTLRGKDQAFWSSAVSADGRNAAFGGSDGAVCIVDIGSGR